MLRKLLAVTSASLLLGFGALFALGSAGGCGPPEVSSLCVELCTCQPCTDNDLADCLAQADGAQQQAAQASCSPAFDAYLTCARSNVRCHDPAAVNSKCLPEIAAVIACDNKVPILGTVCEAAAVKSQVCLDTATPGGFGGTCTGANACVATCVGAATCPQIKNVYQGSGAGEGKPLVDCINACNTAPPPGGG